MADLRPEEVWACEVMSHALGALVQQHDDGSRDGMHDLDIVTAGVRCGAVEVTAAADGESIALWRLLNDGGERWIVPNLMGGWHVSALPTAREKRIRAELPAILRTLERKGVSELRANMRFNAYDLERQVAELDISSLRQSGTGFAGSVYFTLKQPLDKIATWVANTGDGFAIWIGEFLADDRRADVVQKLARSGGPERHVVIVVPGFTEAPMSVTELLINRSAPLPTVAPQLPTAITHVWAMSTWDAGLGMRWSPEDGWAYFDKRLDRAA